MLEAVQAQQQQLERDNTPLDQLKLWRRKLRWFPDDMGKRPPVYASFSRQRWPELCGYEHERVHSCGTGWGARQQPGKQELDKSRHPCKSPVSHVSCRDAADIRDACKHSDAGHVWMVHELGPALIRCAVRHQSSW